MLPPQAPQIVPDPHYTHSRIYLYLNDVTAVAALSENQYGRVGLGRDSLGVGGAEARWGEDTVGRTGDQWRGADEDSMAVVGAGASAGAISGYVGGVRLGVEYLG